MKKDRAITYIKIWEIELFGLDPSISLLFMEVEGMVQILAKIDNNWRTRYILLEIFQI